MSEAPAVPGFMVASILSYKAGLAKLSLRYPSWMARKSIEGIVVVGPAVLFATVFTDRLRRCGLPLLLDL